MSLHLGNQSCEQRFNEVWGNIEGKRKKLLLVINSVRVQDLKLLGMEVMQQVQAISTVCKMMARQEVLKLTTYESL